MALDHPYGRCRAADGVQELGLWQYAAWCSASHAGCSSLLRAIRKTVEKDGWEPEFAAYWCDEGGRQIGSDRAALLQTNSKCLQDDREHNDEFSKADSTLDADNPLHGFDLAVDTGGINLFRDAVGYGIADHDDGGLGLNDAEPGGAQSLGGCAGIKRCRSHGGSSLRSGPRRSFPMKSTGSSIYLAIAARFSSSGDGSATASREATALRIAHPARYEP